MTKRFLARTLALLLLACAVGTAATAIAEEPTTGSEDEDRDDDLLGGFEDEDRGDDLLGGFGDDFDVDSVDTGDDVPAWLAALPHGAWMAKNVDLSGSLSVGAVYSYLDHKVPHGDEVGRSTSWGNLSRLDVDGFLQLDVRLPADWLLRAEALGWYDFVYRIKGRGDYGGAVLDVYEWQVDTGEVYVSGPLHPNVDLTVGRKIVNWGRSDTFRVVDVINPLDNKEPGLVDIEDLRRPVTMGRIDAVSGPWSGQLLVIPEFRYDRDPPRGSDFFPDIPPAQAAVLTSPIDDRSDFADEPGLAGRFDGRFSGWDFSLYGAWVDETRRQLDRRGAFAFRREANRIAMAGAAGNWTRGPILLKFEMAFLHDIRVLRVRAPDPRPFSIDNDRIDSMVGLEYYGRDDLAIAVEIVNRHRIQERDPGTRQFLGRSRFESSLRITRPFFRERMNVTLLAVGFGQRLQNGGLIRCSSDWELTDAWKIEGGILVFIGGPDEGLGAYDSNDRLYAEIQYSF